jgi:hypothetical protein
MPEFQHRHFFPCSKTTEWLIRPVKTVPSELELKGAVSGVRRFRLYIFSASKRTKKIPYFPLMFALKVDGNEKLGGWGSSSGFICHCGDWELF